jgi:hypothetical protein
MRGEEEANKLASTFKIEDRGEVEDFFDFI